MHLADAFIQSEIHLINIFALYPLSASIYINQHTHTERNEYIMHTSAFYFIPT